MRPTRHDGKRHRSFVMSPAARAMMEWMRDETPGDPYHVYSFSRIRGALYQRVDTRIMSSTLRSLVAWSLLRMERTWVADPSNPAQSNKTVKSYALTPRGLILLREP